MKQILEYLSEEFEVWHGNSCVRPETPQFCTLQLMLDDNFLVFALLLTLFTLYALNKNIYNLRSILSYMPITTIGQSRMSVLKMEYSVLKEINS